MISFKQVHPNWRHSVPTFARHRQFQAKIALLTSLGNGWLSSPLGPDVAHRNGNSPSSRATYNRAWRLTAAQRWNARLLLRGMLLVPVAIGRAPLVRMRWRPQPGDRRENVGGHLTRQDDLGHLEGHRSGHLAPVIRESTICRRTDPRNRPVLASLTTLAEYRKRRSARRTSKHWRTGLLKKMWPGTTHFGWCRRAERHAPARNRMTSY